MNRAGNHPTTAAMSCPETLGESSVCSQAPGRLTNTPGLMLRQCCDAHAHPPRFSTRCLLHKACEPYDHHTPRLLHQRGVLGGARAEFGFVFGVGGLQERCPEIWRSINLAVDGSQAARGGSLATPVWRRCAKKANALSRPTDPLRWNGRGAVAGVHLAVEGASLSRHGKKTSVRRPQADRSGLHVRAGALIRALLGSSHRLRWSAGRDDERLNSRADSERLTSPLRSPPDACGRYAVWHPWRRASRLLACAAHPHLRTAPHGFCRSLLDQGKCFCSRVFVFANTW